LHGVRVRWLWRQALPQSLRWIALLVNEPGAAEATLSLIDNLEDPDLRPFVQLLSFPVAYR
jgi:hypothetical protein